MHGIISGLVGSGVLAGAAIYLIVGHGKWAAYCAGICTFGVACHMGGLALEVPKRLDQGIFRRAWIRGSLACIAVASLVAFLVAWKITRSSYLDLLEARQIFYKIAERVEETESLPSEKTKGSLRLGKAAIFGVGARRSVVCERSAPRPGPLYRLMHGIKGWPAHICSTGTRIHEADTLIFVQPQSFISKHYIETKSHRSPTFATGSRQDVHAKRYSVLVWVVDAATGQLLATESLKPAGEWPRDRIPNELQALSDWMHRQRQTAHP